LIDSTNPICVTQGEEAKHWFEEKAALQEEIDSLSKIRAKAAGQVIKANEEATRLEDELGESHMECSSLRRALEDSEERMKHEKQQRGAAVMDMEAMATTMGVQKASGEHEALLQQQELALQVERLEGQKEKMQAQKEKAIEEYGQLEEEMRRSEASLMETTAALQASEGAREKSEEALKTTDEELVSFQEELQRSEVMRREKEAEVSEKTAAIGELSAVVETLKLEGTDGEQARKGLVASLEKAQEERAAVQAERDELEQQLQKSDQRANDRESGLTAQQQQSEGLQREQEEQIGELQEARERLLSENQELQELAKTATQSASDATAAGVVAMQEAEEAHVCQLQEVEEAHAGELREVEEAHRAVMEAEMARHAEDMAGMAAKHEETVDGIQQRFSTEAAVVQEEATAAKEAGYGAAMQAVEEQHAAAMQAVEEQHAAAIQAKEEQHAAAIQAKEEQHAAAIEENDEQHAAAIREREAAHASVMLTVEQERASALLSMEEGHLEELTAKDEEHKSLVEELSIELGDGRDEARRVGTAKNRAQEQVNELNRQNEDLRVRCEEWEAESGSLKKRSDELREELQQLEEESCESAEERGVMRGKLEFAEEALRTSEEKVRSLEESWRESVGMAETMASKSTILEQELANSQQALSARNAELGEQLAVAHSVQLAIPFLKSRCGVALLSRAMSRWQQGELMSAWRRWHAVWSQERLSLQSILARWNNVERSLLSSAWGQWKLRVHEDDVAAGLLLEVEALKNQYAESESLRVITDEARAHTEAAGAEASALVVELREQLSRVEEEASEAKAWAGEAEERIATKEMSTSEMVGSLQEQLQMGAARSEELISYANECRSAALRLVVQRWRTRTQQGTMKQAWHVWHHGWRTQCESEQQKELDALRAQCEKTSAGRAKAEDERDALLTKANAASAQCDDLAARHKVLEAERVTLREELQQLEEESCESAEERGVMRGKLEFAEEALRTSEEKVRSLEEDRREYVAAADEKVRSLEEDRRESVAAADEKVRSLEESRHESVAAADTRGAEVAKLEKVLSETCDELSNLRTQSEEEHSLLRRSMRASQLRLANRTSSVVLSRWRQWRLQFAWRKWTALNRQHSTSEFESLVRSLREEVKQLSDYCHACEREEQASREESSQQKEELGRLKRSNHDFARDLGVARGKLERTEDCLAQADAKRAEAEAAQRQAEQAHASSVELLEKFSERTRQFEHCLAKVYRQVSAGYEYQDGSKFGAETSFREIGVAVQFLLSRFGVTLINRVVMAWRTRSILSAWRRWQGVWHHERSSLRMIIRRWSMLKRTYLSSAWQQWQSNVRTEAVASGLLCEIESLRTQCAVDGSDNECKMHLLEASQQASVQQVEDLQRKLVWAAEEAEEAKAEASKCAAEVQALVARTDSTEEKATDLKQQLAVSEDRLRVASAELAACRTLEHDLECAQSTLREREASARTAEGERDCMLVQMAAAERRQEKTIQEMVTMKSEAELMKQRQQRLKKLLVDQHNTDDEVGESASRSLAEQQRMSVELVRLKQQALCIPLLRMAAALSAAALADAQRKHRGSDGDEREGHAGHTNGQTHSQHRQGGGADNAGSSMGGDKGEHGYDASSSGGSKGYSARENAREDDLAYSDSNDTTDSEDSGGPGNISGAHVSATKNKRLRRKLRALEWENSNLRSGCERLAAQTTGGEIRAREEAMDLAGQVRALEAELGSARESLARREEAAAESCRRDDDLAQARREARASAALVEEREAQLQQAEARLNTIPALEAQLQALRSRLQVTEDRLIDLEECRSRVGQLKEKNAQLLDAEVHLQRRLGEAAIELQSLQEEVKALESKSETDRVLERESQVAEKERWAEAEAAWTRATKVHAETMEKVQEATAVKEADHGTAMQAAEEQHAAVIQAKEAAHTAEISMLEEEKVAIISSMKQELSRSIAAKDEEHKSLVEELSIELGDGRDEARRVGTAKNRAQEQVNELNRQNASLRERCEEWEAESGSLKKRSDELRKELQQLEEESCESAEERGVMRGKLEFAEEALRTSEEKVRSLEEDRRESVVAADAVATKVAKLEQDLSKLQIALQAARADAERQKSMVEQERARVKEVQANSDDQRQRQQQSLKEARQRAAAAESQARDLESAVEDREFEAKQLKEQAASGEAREGRLKKRVEESDVRNRQLATSLEESEARCTGLRKAVGESEEKSRVLQASAMAAQLNSLRGRWTDSEAEVERLKDQVRLPLAQLIPCRF
jgi:chromosome segregation ATPase